MSALSVRGRGRRRGSGGVEWGVVRIGVTEDAAADVAAAAAVAVPSASSVFVTLLPWLE